MIDGIAPPIPATWSFSPVHYTGNGSLGTPADWTRNQNLDEFKWAAVAADNGTAGIRSELSANCYRIIIINSTQGKADAILSVDPDSAVDLDEGTNIIDSGWVNFVTTSDVELANGEYHYRIYVRDNANTGIASANGNVSCTTIQKFRVDLSRPTLVPDAEAKIKKYGGSYSSTNTLYTNVANVYIGATQDMSDNGNPASAFITAKKYRVLLKKKDDPGPDPFADPFSEVAAAGWQNDGSNNDTLFDSNWMDYLSLNTGCSIDFTGKTETYYQWRIYIKDSVGNVNWSVLKTVYYDIQPPSAPVLSIQHAPAEYLQYTDGSNYYWTRYGQPRFDGTAVNDPDFPSGSGNLQSGLHASGAYRFLMYKTQTPRLTADTPFTLNAPDVAYDSGWVAASTDYSPLSSLADGTYYCRIYARDNAGNVSFSECAGDSSNANGDLIIKVDKTVPAITAANFTPHNCVETVTPTFGQSKIDSPLALQQKAGSEVSAADGAGSGIYSYRVQAGVGFTAWNTGVEYDSGDPVAVLRGQLTMPEFKTDAPTGYAGFSAKTFANGNSVKWMVRVEDNVGNVNYTSAMTFTIENDDPAKVTHAYPGDGLWIDKNTFNIKWNTGIDNAGGSGAGHYIVYIADTLFAGLDPAGWIGLIHNSNNLVPTPGTQDTTSVIAASPAWTVPVIDRASYEGKTIYWKVRFYDKALNYVDSDPQTFKFDMTKPTVAISAPTVSGTEKDPIAITGTSHWVNTLKPRLNWSGQEDPDGLAAGFAGSQWQNPTGLAPFFATYIYKVEISEAAGFGTIKWNSGNNGVNAADLNYTIPAAPAPDSANLIDNTTYYYRVRFFDAAGQADAAFSGAAKDGNYNTTPVWSFKCDTTPPDKAILQRPGDDEWVNVFKPEFKWRAGGDSGIGTKEAVIQVSADAGFSTFVVNRPI
ncbi:MAG TPA: hypothetical protein PKL57_14300, partial [Candidatus Wallbacteria bacterium]|nr:hypothetical protein [Candidatus Wallbacteria bacterium]